MGEIMGDVMMGICDVCKEEEVNLDRKYYYNLNFNMVDFCKECDSKKDSFFKSKYTGLGTAFASREELAFSILKTAVKHNEELLDVYIANIAMSFKDEYNRSNKKYINQNDLHEIANKAARNFLELLVK